MVSPMSINIPGIKLISAVAIFILADQFFQDRIYTNPSNEYNQSKTKHMLLVCTRYNYIFYFTVVIALFT